VKISFITPTHAPSIPHVKRLVKSIIDQCQTIDHEIIVVANGPGKERAEDELKDVYDKITLLYQDEPNACKARNAGFERSSGDIVAFPGADFIIHLGTVQRWLEAFNRGYEAVYSGYRWISQDPRQVYLSEPFNEYTLTCYNYIDGGNPVLRTRFKPWDADIKSLQDWDWWLSMVQAGLKSDKIVFIPEPLFSAEFPKAGGLSDDSSKNWIERTNQIKEKHGIPNRKICIASLQKRDEAIELAQIINADFKPMPSFKPHEYDLIYLYGFYADNPQTVYQYLHMFVGHKGKGIIHWFGDDIHMVAKLPWYQVYSLCHEVFNSYRHYNMSQEASKLLMKMGVESTYRLPPLDVQPSNFDGFKVGISLNFLDQAKKALPDVEIVDREKEAASVVLLPDGSMLDGIKAILTGSVPVLQQNLAFAQKMEAIRDTVNLRKIIYKTVREIQAKWPINIRMAQKHYLKETNKTKFIREVTGYAKRDRKDKGR